MKQDFAIKNREGLSLYGDVFIGEENREKKLVFLQHGLSGHREQPYYKAIKETLCDNGFSVCSFDATHSFGKSDGELENASFERHAHDLEDVIAWASGQSWYSEPFSLVGHSLGAASILSFAANSKKCARLVALSPVTGKENWIYAFQRYRAQEWEEWQREGRLFKKDAMTGKSGYLTNEFIESLSSFDSKGVAKNLSSPVLFLVGENDLTAPKECVESFLHLFPPLIQSKSCFEIIPNAPHTFAEVPHLELVCSKILKWLC